MKVLIANGGTAFRRYTADIRKRNKVEGICKKTVSKKDDQGRIYWSKVYYYRKVQRPREEYEELVEGGTSPSNAFYREVYVGSEKPKGYEEDELSHLKKEGLVELKGKDLLTDESTYKELLEIAPSYFQELETYVIK